MCNLYSVTTTQAAIRALARALGEAWQDLAGNLEALPAVFPDQMSPVVMNAPIGAMSGTRLVLTGGPGCGGNFAV
jgi:putative SOS response-associated peptidase YedK